MTKATKKIDNDDTDLTTAVSTAPKAKLKKRTLSAFPSRSVRDARKEWLAQQNPVLIIDGQNFSDQLVQVDKSDLLDVFDYHQNEMIKKSGVIFHYQHGVLDIYMTHGSKFIFNQSDWNDVGNNDGGVVVILNGSLSAKYIIGKCFIYDARVKAVSIEDSSFITDSAPEYRKTVVRHFNHIEKVHVCDSRIIAHSGWNRLRDSRLIDTTITCTACDINESFIRDTNLNGQNFRFDNIQMYKSSFNNVSVEATPPRRFTIDDVWVQFGYGELTAGAPTIELNSPFDVLKIDLGKQKFTFVKIKNHPHPALIASVEYDKSVKITKDNLYDREIYKRLILGENYNSSQTLTSPTPVGFGFNQGCGLINYDRGYQSLDAFTDAIVTSLEQSVQSRYRLVEMLNAVVRSGM